jgi:hypothetical protein
MLRDTLTTISTSGGFQSRVKERGSFIGVKTKYAFHA